MNVGISTASFYTKVQVEDAIPLLSTHGVPLTEIFLNTFSEYQRSFTRILYNQISDTELTVYSVHPHSTHFEPQLFSDYPRQREDALSYYRLILSDAHHLGAKYYVMHGYINISNGANLRNIRKTADTLTELSEIASHYDIRLLLENVSWCILRTPEIGEELSSLLGDSLFYTLDIKQAVRSGFTPYDFIRVLGKRIRNVHLCDYVINEEGAPVWKLPGEGSFDFSKLKAALSAVGYTGPVLIEAYSNTYRETEDVFASARKMSEIFQT